MWPFSVIRAQNKEISRLLEQQKERVWNSVSVERVEVENRGSGLKVTGSPIDTFAIAFVEQFKKSSATNFIVSSFVDADTDEKYEITMLRLEGESTASQLERLRGEIADLKNENSRLKMND